MIDCRYLVSNRCQILAVDFKVNTVIPSRICEHCQSNPNPMTPDSPVIIGFAEMLNRKPTPIDKNAIYRAIWAKLHRYALSVSVWDAAAAKAWFEKWQKLIPSVGCECRKQWDELVEECPPDFSSALAFFTWTFDCHNDVNVRLGKPIFSFEDACVLYGWP